MSSSSTPEQRPADFLCGAWATRIGLLLLLGLALVLALAIVDRPRRAQLESFQEVTAVGDRNFFAPGPDPTAPTVLTWSGGQVEIGAAEHLKMRDSSVRKVGLDEATGVAIYAPGPATSADAGASRFLVKVAPGEYLPATPSAR